jgi:hypothetical protein
MIKKITFCTIVYLVSFTATAQFKSGYYFTKNGDKVAGLLRFDYGRTRLINGSCRLLFKPSKEEKTKRFTAGDICCFVIEKDSFAILEHFEINLMEGRIRDFAQVLEKGKINLFLYRNRITMWLTSLDRPIPISQSTADWMIAKHGLVDKLTKRYFKKSMPRYLADYPELAEKVRANLPGYQYKNAAQIIFLYNEHFRHQHY